MHQQRRQFASDNYAPVPPEAWRALQEANTGHAAAYGADPWTERATALLQDVFETDCEVFFVFNGTAANALALACMCRPYNSVICHRTAHVHTDECGAPEMFTGGAKLLTVGGRRGKIDPEALASAAGERRDDVHWPLPGAVTVTQATEMGTVYSAAELAVVSDVARRNGLALHMDGARFANAVAALGVAPRAVSWEAGVDVLSLGGTKLGNPGGDALVFFNRRVAEGFRRRRKQAGQLASKMRYLAAPWIGMLEGDAWLRHARHANAMARRLADAIAGVEGVELLMPTQANAVFARLPRAVIRGMCELGWVFYTFIGDDGVRLMCSWDTEESDVQRFAADLERCAGSAP